MRNYLILLFLLIPFFLFSINKDKTDSLVKVLGKKITDAEKIDTYLRLVNELRQYDTDSAFCCANKALALSKKINNQEKIASSFNNLAIVYYFYSNYDKSEECYNKALKIFHEIKDTLGISTTYTNIGSLYDELGNYNLALEYHIKALKIAEEINSLEDLSICYNNVGLIHYRMENYDKAMEYYNKSADVRTELKDTTGLALIYNNIGILYYYEEEYEKVLEYFKKALEIWENSNNKRQVSLVLFNLGELYFDLGLYESALNYTEEAYQADIELKDQYAQIGDNTLMGNIYLGMKQYSNAKRCYEKAINIAIELDAFIELKDIYNSLSDYYSKTDNYKLALYYYVKFHNLNDSIFNVQKSEIFTEMQTKYETDKKEQEIEQQKITIEKEQAENDKKSAQRNIVILGLGLMIILAFVIFRSYKRKQKDNTILIRQKDEISEKNEELNQQNEEIATQRDEIESQRDFVTEQRDLISNQKESITASIAYAKRIQKAMLPKEDFSKSILKDYFILNLPKDVVSGDFYWVSEINNQIIVAVADCTGHGVPGGFMSMLGISFLTEIIKKSEVTKANQILNHLRQSIIEALQQKGDYNEQQDGMDISICVIDKRNNTLQYAGANNPLYIIRNEELKMTNGKIIKFDNSQLETCKQLLYEIKPDKMPIAIHKRMDNFTNHTIEFQKGDFLYMFTDGFADQFGGKNNKNKNDFSGVKFKYKPFKNLFLQNVEKSPEEQKEVFFNTFKKWKGDFNQVDDILIMGIKL